MARAKSNFEVFLDAILKEGTNLIESVSTYSDFENVYADEVKERLEQGIDARIYQTEQDIKRISSFVSDFDDEKYMKIWYILHDLLIDDIFYNEDHLKSLTYDNSVSDLMYNDGMVRLTECFKGVVEDVRTRYKLLRENQLLGMKLSEKYSVMFNNCGDRPFHSFNLSYLKAYYLNNDYKTLSKLDNNVGSIYDFRYYMSETDLKKCNKALRQMISSSQIRNKDDFFRKAWSLGQENAADVMKDKGYGSTIERFGWNEKNSKELSFKVLKVESAISNKSGMYIDQKRSKVRKKV